MKSLIKFSFELLFLLLANISHSQTAKDFFFPSNGLNAAVFHQPTTSGDVMVRRKITYGSINGEYEISDINYFKNKEMSSSFDRLKITETEIYKLRSSITGMMGNSDKTFTPPVLLFKLPVKGKSVSWNTVIDGEKEINTAIWTTVIVDGTTKAAIKISNRYEKFKNYENRYYVLGIGLWKSEIVGENGKIVVTDIQDDLIKEN